MYQPAYSKTDAHYYKPPDKQARKDPQQEKEKPGQEK